MGVGRVSREDDQSLKALTLNARIRVTLWSSGMPRTHRYRALIGGIPTIERRSPLIIIVSVVLGT